MRTDILFDNSIEDVALKNQSVEPCYNIEWSMDDSGNIVDGIVSLPEGISLTEAQFTEEGILISYEYLPIYKIGKIKIIDSQGTQFNNKSYEMATYLGGAYFDFLRVSQLPLISMNKLRFRLSGDKIVVSDGEELDFVLGPANSQNKNFMLKCTKGNNYAYPTTGVGLVDWFNSPSSLDGLADTLLDEFAKDLTPVMSAFFNEDKTKLIINLNTSEVD